MPKSAKTIKQRFVSRNPYSIEYKTLIQRERKLRGKYVVIISKRVFTAKNGKEASRILAEVRKKFPEKTPLATFVPDADTLILWL